MPWLLALATTDADTFVRDNRDLLATGFPIRARAMLEVARGAAPHGQIGRGLALIDPASRRREWLVRASADGRRSAAPYLDTRSAARKLGLVRPGGQAASNPGNAVPRAPSAKCWPEAQIRHSSK
jgi:hypothetical protein